MSGVSAPQSKLVLNAFAAYFENEMVTAQAVDWKMYDGEMSDNNRLQVVEQVKNRATVLLVNSSQGCAGLNMQCATDLVFFHKILDTNIEEQVCGRAQRIGRVCNLGLHYLLYNNEQAYV